MPQITLKIEVPMWDALEVRGMTENEVMREMEHSAYDKLRELQREHGMEDQ